MGLALLTDFSEGKIRRGAHVRLIGFCQSTNNFIAISKHQNIQMAQTATVHWFPHSRGIPDTSIENLPTSLGDLLHNYPNCYLYDTTNNIRIRNRNFALVTNRVYEVEGIITLHHLAFRSLLTVR